MRIFLLIIATLLSIGVFIFTCLFLLGKVTNLVYAVASSIISIFLIFALFHFVYLYLKQQLKK